MITRAHKTCLIYNIDKGLRVVSEEATNHVALIPTREDHFDQEREFMQSECTSGQTFAGCDIKVGKAGIISAPYNVGEGGTEDIPPPDLGVVTVLREGMGRVSSKGGFGALRESSIPRILEFCPLTLPLL